MLESAITRSSDSVGLDLLTYEDLEHMWEKKLGPISRRGGGAHSPVGSKAQAKRYLILTYNVEFDRIHYPLALSYCGQPDPRVLQDIIRKLQAELDSTRKEVSLYIYGYLICKEGGRIIWMYLAYMEGGRFVLRKEVGLYAGVYLSPQGRR